MDWAHGATAITAGFLGALVEFVEALTIVLAVGLTRGWRSALLGAAGGTLTLVVLTITLGSSLSIVPVSALQLVIGVLLLVFGVRWLKKAMLRSAGVIPMHDETRIFERETAALSSGAIPNRGIDVIAFATSFKAVLLEGVEVIFIVIATGANGRMGYSALGAGIALLIVLAAGILLRKPLARIPENALKYSVGVLLTGFGVFWIGEGLKYEWPGGDMALPVLVAGVLLVSVGGVRLLQKK